MESIGNIDTDAANVSPMNSYDTFLTNNNNLAHHKQYSSILPADSSVNLNYKLPTTKYHAQSQFETVDQVSCLFGNLTQLKTICCISLALPAT
jgi:hypothetical protein